MKQIRAFFPKKENRSNYHPPSESQPTWSQTRIFNGELGKEGREGGRKGKREGGRKKGRKGNEIKKAAVLFFP